MIINQQSNKNQFTVYCCLSLCDWKVQYVPDYLMNFIGRNSENNTPLISKLLLAIAHACTHTHTYTDMLEEVSVLGPGYDWFLCHCHINIKEQIRIKLRNWNLLIQLEQKLGIRI